MITSIEIKYEELNEKRKAIKKLGFVSQNKIIKDYPYLNLKGLRKKMDKEGYVILRLINKPSTTYWYKPNDVKKYTIDHDCSEILSNINKVIMDIGIRSHLCQK